MIERTTVRLPASLLATAKAKARAEGRTLTSLIEDGLRIVVVDRPPVTKRDRVLPPVSGSTGGFRADINPHATYSELQELEDIDYIEHLKRL